VKSNSACAKYFKSNNLYGLMGTLASTYSEQGWRKEAETLEVQVMEASKRVLGDEYPDALKSMNNLACTLKGHGRPMEAIGLMEECVKLREQAIEVDHPDTLSSSAALAGWNM
jgi:hypothetical protein